MQIVEHSYHPRWEIRLTLEEWPPLDWRGSWRNRAMYRWVHENCSPVQFIASRGRIYFGNREDAVLFQLTWQ